MAEMFALKVGSISGSVMSLNLCFCSADTPKSWRGASSRSASCHAQAERELRSYVILINGVLARAQPKTFSLATYPRKLLL